MAQTATLPQTLPAEAALFLTTVRLAERQGVTREDLQAGARRFHAALEARGVTVPDGERLDAVARLHVRAAL